jgi:hypothetical protein
VASSLDRCGSALLPALDSPFAFDLRAEAFEEVRQCLGVVVWGLAACHQRF